MNGIDFLADTNFLIQVHEGKQNVEAFLDYHFTVSYITEIELLGKFSISKHEKILLQNIINDCFVIDMNQKIKQRTILLRQRYKIKTPEAIIAATAIEFQIPLISSDSDFTIIKELDFLLLKNV
ncbi:MAG: PIN domain-containing protein [Bacteroidetes bacterium]|nr:PIN domain-containing protein [Bacteroidota bacterium]